MNKSLWLARFEACEKPGEIRRRTERIPLPLVGLEGLPIASAMIEIRQTLSELFVVTPKVEEILREILRFGEAAAFSRYSDQKVFLERCFDKDYIHPPFPPLGITGAAGIGKTQLCKAASNLVPDRQTVVVDGNYDPFVMRGFVRIKMQRGDVDRTLTARVAKALGIQCSSTGKGADIEYACGKIGYRDAVAALLLDEFQHVTLSTANARIASMLLTARELGMPAGFVCNFSLMHRLQARPQEDRDRLLRNVIVYTRETPESEGWLMMVRETLSVIGSYGQLVAEEVACELGRLSGCLPRNLHRLLELSYSVCREAKARHITMFHVRKAFHSRAYASARTDIRNLDAIASGDKTMAKARPDLCCPEEFIQDSAPAEKGETEGERLKVMSKHLLQRSMTTAEKKGLKIATEQMAKQAELRKKVVSINAKKPRTAQSLLDAHDDFQ